jgi:hypothetical protein
MKKYIMISNNLIKQFLQYIIILIFFVQVGCDDMFQDEKEMKLFITVDPRLPQDNNGYYHLTLNKNKWQTIHRFTGLVTDQNENPIDVVRFNWESNLYWIMNDTLGYIIKRGLTDSYEYVNYDTLYMIGFEGSLVPTINPASYSNSKGEFNQMCGFTRNMIGDTAEITITYGIREVTNLSNIIKFSVILD